MDAEEISQQCRDKGISIDDPSFFELAYSFVARKRKKRFFKEPNNFKRTAAEEFDALSIRLDRTGFQESCSARNVIRTRRLANLLINDKGELNYAVLPKLITFLKQHLYFLGPNRQYDAKRQELIVEVMTKLNESKDLKRCLNVIDKPHAHKVAEEIIRNTLQLPANEILTDAHAKRAALSAWMCLLRQNVGSCFATAPAIIVHDEQPEQFFKDISELFATGRLKRTFGGIEYSVPLSASWGAGDLKKPFLLPLGENFKNSHLFLSPGLEAAFLAAGLISEEEELSKRQKAVRSKLIAIVSTFPKHLRYAVVTPEEIIQKALFYELQITEQDVYDYENRPRGMIYGGLLMHVTPAKGKEKDSFKGKSKGELAAIYLSKLADASNAFKGIVDNALLKAWEFTIASFAETKSQFTRWNLYSSLGLGPNDQGGIGAVLFETIKRKVDYYNERLKEVQYEYELIFSQLKTIEMRMQSASEREAQWIKMEYQTKRNEFYTLEEMRGDIRFKAERFANMFDPLIDQLDALFPKYFQEVYDADMHDVTAGPYDDSPAGFRLLYKYGRANTSQWTSIKTPNEFIENLVAFFIAVEPELVSAKPFEGMDSDISEIVTAIVTHVRTNEFLETAFYRMAQAHNMPIIKDPLENLDKIEKKPWAYTSGGTMATLVSCYYKREQKPTEASRWVENPIELLVFIVDTLKQVPYHLMEPYLSDPKKSMLMHSPTHAFLLKPGSPEIKRAWQTDAFTYTFVRDRIVAKREQMVNSLYLNEEMLHFLVEKLSASVQEDYRHYFRKVFGNIYGTMRPKEFREHLLDGIHKENGLRQAGRSILSAEEIDSALYSLLPLFSRSQLRDKLEEIYQEIPSIDDSMQKRLLSFFDEMSTPASMESIISSATLQEIAKALICLATEETSFPVDYHAEVSKACEKLKIAMPAPIIFADTNWVKEEFGFVVNPGTGRLELWRVDGIGSKGAPMSQWKQWLDGSRQDITWGIYNRPFEYH